MDQIAHAIRYLQEALAEQGMKLEAIVVEGDHVADRLHYLSRRDNLIYRDAMPIEDEVAIPAGATKINGVRVLS